MVSVRRRHFLSGILLAIPALAQKGKETIRGVLANGPALRTPQGRVFNLEGDEQTTGVLKDKRVIGADVELTGSFAAPERFVIDPIHTRAMFVHKDGKKLMVTYWCEVCSIRTYTPGICWCCQEETVLDLIEGEK